MKPAGLLLLAGLGAACATTPVVETPFPTGRWVVTGYELPRERVRGQASLPYQSFVRREFLLGDDWIETAVAGQPPCAPRGYRQRVRWADQEERFDPAFAASYDAGALGLKGKQVYEVRTGGCLEDFYLSWDRSRIYLPIQGALLILEPSGRTRFERDPLPDPTPTAVVEKIGFDPKVPTAVPRD